MNNDHYDALNMLRCYEGLGFLDLFVMSIEKSIINDLIDLKLSRKVFLGWEITHLGRKVLKEKGINDFWDTRR